MKVVEISQHGGPEVLKIAERPKPELQAGQVLIKVHAAGVNRTDVLQRTGVYPPPPDASDLPGLEIAGEIVEGDVDGTGFSIGDKVCALVAGGGYAQYCAVDVGHCLPIPTGMSYIEAAGLPETYFTVWSNVYDRAQLKPGESFLVHGGASGIGTTAIQLAVARGHKVFATAGSDERVAAVEALGAVGINYRTQEFEKVIKEATNRKGVDVILDMVAGDYINRDIRCLADDGRIVIIALLGGAKGQVDFAHILTRRLVITGSTLRPRHSEFKTDIAANLKAEVWPLLESGVLKPLVYASFPLEEVQKAHAMMDAGEQVGKIILEVSH